MGNFVVLGYWVRLDIKKELNFWEFFWVWIVEWGVKLLWIVLFVFWLIVEGIKVIVSFYLCVLWENYIIKYVIRDLGIYFF